MGEKVPLIARAVGGKVVGPRPGKAIVTFWQGIVEIILRVVVIVLSASALIAAGVALTPKYDAPPKYDTERKSAGSLVVGVALVTVAVELIFIILRFLNVGLLNYKIKWFLIVDAILSAVLGLVFLAATGVSAWASHQWKGSGKVSNALAAAAALSFLSMLALGGLGVWSMLFMINKWNKKVVVYTLKDAVLG